MAAEEELTHENVCTEVLNEVALRHPIVFDVFNLCDMPAGSGKLRQLSLAMLLSICQHFDIYVESIKGRRKVPYLSFLRDFLESCDRPLSQGGHFESQENKKLCFCTSTLALDERLDVQNLMFQHCVIKVYCHHSPCL